MNMDIEQVTNEQEWQWCLVGNIVEEHEYGEDHVILRGNKQFRPNAKVFINLIYGGMGHENILVIGLPRRSRVYIEVVTARKYVCNFRLKKVFKPAVLNKIKKSKHEWWGNTDEARDRIIKVAELFNSDEAEKREKQTYG